MLESALTPLEEIPSLSTEELEDQLVEQMQGFFNDPLGHVMFSYPWGEEGTDLEDQEGPDDWQVELLTDLGRGTISVSEALRIAVKSGHGVGKSAVISWIILWFMSTRPNCNGRVTASTGTQLRTTTWRELALWHSRAINSHWFEITATKIYQVDNPETWVINAVTWNKDKPQSFAGMHAEYVLMIFDEGSTIADIIWEVAEGAMTTAGSIWLVAGNPEQNTGRFRECWGKFKDRWIGITVDSRTAKMADKALIAQWAEDYGEDSDFFKIRVLGEFPSVASSQFIPESYYKSALARASGPEGTTTPKVMGIDVARFGSDRSVIVVREGAYITEKKVYRGLDTVELANEAARLINVHHPRAVMVDGVGVGAGVVDNLRAANFDVIEINGQNSPSDKKKYANLRAEMWGKLRDWVNRRAILLEPDEELKIDLTAIQYGHDGRGRIQMEKKEDMKRRGQASPDIADAVALTFGREVASDEVAGMRTSSRSTHANLGYAGSKRRMRTRRR
jgi:hypothetical protein